MMNKKIFVIIITSLLIASLGIISATDTNNTDTNTITKQTPTIQTQTEPTQNKIQNKNITKKTQKNTKQATTTAVNNYDELINEVNTAKTSNSDEYIINLKAGDYNATGNITWGNASGTTRTLTINGNNITLDGQKKYQFIKILKDYNLNLKNIAFLNYNTNYEGVISNYGNLTITQSTLNNNNATSGGAINNYKGTLTITNSTLNNNTAIAGGAIRNDGNMTINNCTLNNNTATNEGGAIDNFLGNITITNSNLNNNTAKGTDEFFKEGGGAINNYKGNITITNSTLNNKNILTQYGGAIDNREGILTINNCTLNNNAARKSGGAIYNEAGKLTITNCTLNNNKAIGSEYYFGGGAICNDDGTLTIINSTLNNNTAKYYGGAIRSSGNLTITQSTLNNNTAENNGGAISGSGTITNSTLNNNTSNRDGGAISGSITITNCTLNNNNAKYEGGAISGSITITNSTLNNNNAKYEGGAISGSGTITNSTLNNNTANSGGAIHSYTTLIIKNSNLNKNKATYNGGAINNNRGNITIHNTTLTHNSARVGGAIYGNGTINNSTLTYNTAKKGGAIYTGNITINDSYLFYNRASENGGAIYHEQSYLSINNSIFRNNSYETIYPNTDDMIHFDIHNSTIYEEKYYINTKIEIESKDKYSINENITLNLSLTDLEGNIIPNSTLTIKIYQENYKVTTNEYGKAIFTYTPTLLDSPIFTVIYNGKDVYNKTNTSKQITISKIDTKITLNPINPVTLSENIQITGKLTTYDNKPLSNTALKIKVNNDTYTSNSNEEGIFNLTYKTSTTGTNNIEIIFDGNNNYTNSSLITTFSVIKINTKIGINKIPPSKYLDSITITGTLKDEKENPIQDTITLTINNQNHNINTNKQGEYTYTTITNTPGINNITINYNGNNNYNGSTTKTTFTVNKLNTKLTITPINTKKYNDTITITGTLRDENDNVITNTPITLEINNNIYTLTTDNNGEYTYTTIANIIGTNSIIVQYEGNNNYATSKSQTTFNVEKLASNIKINTIPNSKYGNTVIITGTLKDEKENPIQDTITLIINNQNHNINTNKQGEYTYTILADTIGTNNITSTYNGNTYNTANSIKTSFTVNKLNTKLTITPINTKKYEDTVTITGTLKDENNNPIQDTMILTINNKGNYINTNKEGEYTYTIITNTLGTNNITLIYNENMHYTGNNIKTSFTVNKLNTIATISPITNKKYGEKNTITGTLKDENNNPIQDTITLTINKNTYTLTTTNTGTFTQTITGDIGTNDVTLTYNGNNKYNKAETKSRFTIEKQDTTITIDKIPATKYTETLTLTGKLTDNNKNIIPNSDIKITINNQTISMKTDEKGTFTYKYQTKHVGTNNITATYNGNTNYNTANTQTTFTVNKLDTKITINKIKAAYSDNITITGKLTDNNNIILPDETVKININGKTITTKTDKNGQYSYKYQTKHVGTNNITITHPGTTTHAYSSHKSTFKVNKLDLQITINKIKTSAYGENITIKGTFKDKNGKILGNSKLKLNINGKTVTIKVNKNGIFTYKHTTKKVGTNNITITHQGNKNYNKITKKTTFTVTKQKLKITLNRTTKVGYGSKVYIKGQLTDKHDKTIKNTVITININGKIIRAKTNSKGIYNHSLTTTKLGTNNITVTYPGNKNYYKITKKTTFTVTKQNVKITATAKQVKGTTKVTITGTLKTKDGKTLRNSVVTLNINGKNKKAKTNNKGVFTLTTTAKKGTNTLLPSFTGNKYYNKYKGTKTTFKII